MRKQICLALLVTVLLIAQPVCSEQITLRVSTWLSSQEEGEMYQRWADKYTETHPNVKVQFEVATLNKLLTEAAAGVAPDILRVERNQFTSMADQNLIKPIPTEWLSDLNLNDLFPASRAQGTYKGRLYGWDPHVGVMALHFNKLAFDAAGMAYPDNTWTWDTLAVSAKKLTKRNPDGQTSQFGLNPNYTRPGEIWFMNTWTQGGDMFNATLKPLFPDTTTTKSLNYLRDLVQNGVSPAANIDLNKALVTGTAAMNIQGTWQNPAYEAADKISHGVTVTPHDAQRATMATLHLWGMSAVTKYPKETWELFKYWVGVQNALEFTNYGGAKAQGLPVWRTAMRDPKWHISVALKPALEMMDYTRVLPFTPGMGPWFGKANQIIREVMIQNKPVTQALEEIAHEASLAFETAGAYR